MKKKVFIADDHQIFRDGIKLLISFNDNYEFIGEAPDGISAFQQIKLLKPDLVLMDITMPGMSGIEVCRFILKELPQTKIIFLTMHNDSSTINDAKSTGAHGYVFKKSGKDILETAIAKVLDGETYFEE